MQLGCHELCDAVAGFKVLSSKRYLRIIKKLMVSFEHNRSKMVVCLGCTLADYKQAGSGYSTCDSSLTSSKLASSTSPKTLHPIAPSIGPVN